MEGKLAWRRGSACHSKSGTKNFAKFFSLSLASPPPTPHTHTHPFSLLFFSLKFLFGDYPQVSLLPLPPCVSSSPPALTTERWGGMGDGGESRKGGYASRGVGGSGGALVRRRAAGGRGDGCIGVRASPLATNTLWRHHKTEQMTPLPLGGLAGEEERGGGRQSSPLVKSPPQDTHN